MGIAILDYGKKLGRAIEGIENSDSIDPCNSELIKEYKRDQILKDLKPSAIYKNVYHLKKVAEQIEMDFREADRDDLKDQ